MFVKTLYSIATATATVKDIVNGAKEIDEEALVLLDDSFCAVTPFYKECKKEDIKPIIGLERVIDGVTYGIICKNDSGYRHLIAKYSTELKVEDLLHDDLEIIIFDFKTQDDLNKALELFPNAYIGIYSYKDPEKYIRARALYAQKGSRKVVVMNVATHLNKEDSRSNVAIKAIINKTSFNKENEIFDNMYLKSTEGHSQWLNNQKTLEDSCVDDYNFGHPVAPKFIFTEEIAVNEGLPSSTTEAELFAYMSRKGLDKRLEIVPEEKHEMYKARLEVEIGIINSMKFPGYMLIVWDFVKAAKERNIPVGPGRGSAAGSLVAFALGITNIDPMPYNLLFERFLNPERVSMPDIDMDFSQGRREDVIKYVIEKYGEEQVAQIITFMKLKPRGTIRDVSRIYGYPLLLADKFAKTIPDDPGMTFAKAYKAKGTEIDLIIEDPLARKVYDTAKKLENLNRGVGTHAAGVIITDRPVYEKAPIRILTKGKKTTKVIEVEGEFTEDNDLIKFDFLGIKTLDVNYDAVDMIKKNHNKTIELDFLDFNDQAVYKQIQEGNTLGLFQIESDGMQGLCQRLKPDCFEDLIAILALYRPGPMESGMLDDFIARKNGDKAVTYFYDEYTKILKPILEPTYGVIVYQEQVMQIVQEIGNFSLGDADLVRRAMGKKKDLSVYINKFADGAVEQGLNRENAVEFFHKIEEFAGYGFNKSHSAAYAMISFQTAYLKHYYPAEFMASLMNHNDPDKIAKYIADCKRMDLIVLKPDVNTSRERFETDDSETIFYSISKIKGVGSGAKKVVKERDENGLFTSVDNYLERFKKPSMAVFKALVNSGAFDNLSPVRKPLLEPNATEDYSLQEKLEIELDILGYYITDPFARIENVLAPYNIPTVEELTTGVNYILVFPQEIVSRTAKKTGKEFLILTGFFFGGEVMELAGFQDDVIEKLKNLDMTRPAILKLSKKGEKTYLNDVLDLKKTTLENSFTKK